MTDAILSREQKRFLEECEEEFKDRYTGKDSNFMNIKMQEPKKPPIVDPWYNKSRRYERHDQTRSRYNHYWKYRDNDKNEKSEQHRR